MNRAACIDGSEVRRHLAFLSSQGVGLYRVAEAAGVGSFTLKALKRGGMVTPRVAEAVLGVGRSKARDGAYVPSAETAELVRRLVAAGVDRKALPRIYGPRIRAGRARRVEEVARVVLAREDERRRAIGRAMERAHGRRRRAA